jgi:conjugative transfer signal peptidase TraF
MKKLRIISMTTIGCLTLLAIAASLAGIRINTTPSYPIGIYLMTNDPIEKGALVIFCPTDTAIFRQAKERGYIGAGFCPGGTSHMIKKIMATTNDAVEFSGIGVLVNGALLSNSKPMEKDAEVLPLSTPKAVITALDDHTILLMSDYNQKSFDARYFGLIDKAQIISVVRPVWTW